MSHVPKKLPWPGSGPSEWTNGDLAPFGPEPTTAEGGEDIEAGALNIWGRHRAVQPGWLLEDAANNLTSFSPIQSEADTTHWEVWAEVVTRTTQYEFDLSESAGGNSVRLQVPAGDGTSTVEVRGFLPISVLGWTVLSITPVSAAPHCTIKRLHLQSKVAENT